MDLRSQLRGTPRALKEMLEKGRPEFDALVRRTRWGEGPLLIIASDSTYPAALAGAYAFEGLLGWPVKAIRACNFIAYSASLIRPRSLVLALSHSGESDLTLEAALHARSCGASLLAVTTVAASPLSESADGVFLLQGGGLAQGGLHTDLCMFAAMGFIAVTAAQVLKRHHQKLDELEGEYGKLSEHAEWVLARLQDAAKSLASELRNASCLTLVGAGPYHCAALDASRALRKLALRRTMVQEPAELLEQLASGISGSDAILFLSGSRCRLKKEIHEAALQARLAEAKMFALTDSNDRGLSDAASLAVLLPGLHELTGSTLTLFSLHLLVSHLM